jgi:probable H4MPT-linked C1 transfer pathway protein
MNWIGLDIGGANIKVADADGSAASAEFPLWRNKNGLKLKLDELLSEFPGHFRLAVTMTGELADCYASKQEGVQHIVDSVVAVSRGAAPVFYQTNGCFVEARTAIAAWQSTAATNWHALATFAARLMPDNSGILVDVGSTTTDIIPVSNRTPCSKSCSDTHRLQAGELVYTGISRSPVNGLLQQVRIDGVPTRIANELFATTLDAHVYLGNLPESSSVSTADGRPATIPCSAQRLARVVCADVAEIGAQNVRTIAEEVVKAQTTLIARALDQVFRANASLKTALVISGSGGWLVSRYLRDCLDGARVVEFSEVISQSASDCAPAVAVAQLARESAHPIPSS